MSGVRLIAAPLQGLTEAAWRNIHATVCGGADEYRAPFARTEHGAIRPRDLREIAPGPVAAVPQVIARDADEFRTLASAVAAAGHTRIDLNLGCPFPPQVRKGRGAGLLARPDTLAGIAEAMRERPDLQFSVKMRLGTDSPWQWRDALGAINSMPLCEVTVHPRTAAQQYGGELHLEAFAALADALAHPVIYNGDIATPSDIDRVLALRPSLAGVMAGRALIGRPTLFAEWRSGTELPAPERLQAVMNVLDALLDRFSQTLCGDSQILSKIKPYWEYLEPVAGRKAWKAVRKSTSVAKYRAAVAEI